MAAVKLVDMKVQDLIAQGARPTSCACTHSPQKARSSMQYYSAWAASADCCTEDSSQALTFSRWSCRHVGRLDILVDVVRMLTVLL